MGSAGLDKLWRCRQDAPRRQIILAISLLSLLSLLLCYLLRDQLLYHMRLLAGSAGVGLLTSDISRSDFPEYAGMKRLQFKADGTFQIAVLEDSHLGEAEDTRWGPSQDKKTVEVIHTILEAEDPDFVVLNGDLITGDDTFLHNSTKYLDLIMQPLASKGYPFAATYGNHDNKFNLSTLAMLDYERKKYSQLGYTRSMIGSEDAGVSNFVLPIYQARSNRLAVLLWFFDSRGGSKFQQDQPGDTEDERQIPIPGHVHQTVVDWFLRTHSQMTEKHGNVPSLAFVHIPIFATYAFQKAGVDSRTEPGIDDDDPCDPQGLYGGKYTAGDFPFMKALVDVGVKAVFSGHNHGDDFCFRWDDKLPGMTFKGNGAAVCFGRHTGYGGYGDWTRGSRQILLRQGTIEDEIESWIRLEDKSVSGAVVLNETYGTDQYPVVRASFTYPPVRKPRPG